MQRDVQNTDTFALIDSDIVSSLEINKSDVTARTKDGNRSTMWHWQMLQNLKHGFLPGS
jgi:hypothetical protein